MTVFIGGPSVLRHPVYLSFMPWVLPVWNQFPHFYDPLPDIYFERLVGSEVGITTPAILTGKQGELIRVLSRQLSIEAVAFEVCGSNGTFEPADSRSNSRPRLTKTELGFNYVTGRFVCVYQLPTSFSAAAGSKHRPQMNAGWSHPEPWGIWTVGMQSTLQLNFHPFESENVAITIVGTAFVNEAHPKQEIILMINGQQADAWTVTHPVANIDRRIIIDKSTFSSESRLSFEFKLPNAISPSTLGLSGDKRTIALGLIEMRLEAHK
jgi:hypothetical protein